MKKTLIGTLLATVASAILALPAGAGKPVDSATCVKGGQTTVTWISGTTSAQVTWRDVHSVPVGVVASITVTTHGPDSTVLDNTPANADTANVNFYGKKPAFAVGVC